MIKYNGNILFKQLQVYSKYLLLKFSFNNNKESFSTGILSTFKTKCRVFYENEFKV